MENAPSGKSTKLIPKMLQVLPEVIYGVRHLDRSNKQKDRINPQEARDFLTATKNLLPQENSYFTNQENPVVIEHVGSGYFNSCWKFETSKGAWIIKIAHNQTPMKTEFQPSSEEYSRKYKESLDIQRSIFDNQLPNLIPKPQEVLHIKGKERVATVVIQPFIEAIMPFNQIKGLSPEQQQDLKEELKTFLNLCKTMRKQHGIAPDLIRAGGRHGHFVVAQTRDGPHLVMLDNDVFDKRDYRPLFNLLNNLAVNLKVNLAIRKLE